MYRLVCFAFLTESSPVSKTPQGGGEDSRSHPGLERQDAGGVG